MDYLLRIENEASNLLSSFYNLKTSMQSFDTQLFVVEDSLFHSNENINFNHMLTLSSFTPVDTLPIASFNDLGSNITPLMTYRDGNIPNDILFNPRIVSINDTVINGLTNIMYSIDISKYFTKSIYFQNEVIHGYIDEAYLVDSCNNMISPKQPPRDGIFNSRHNVGNFEYIGLVDNGMLYVFPDYRNQIYRIKLRVWLGNYSNEKYVLDDSTFIVSESYINTDTIYYSNLTNIPQRLNVRTLFSTTAASNNIGYRLVVPDIRTASYYTHIPVASMDGNYLIINPDFRDIQYSLWVESYVISLKLSLFRLQVNIAEEHIPRIVNAVDRVTLSNLLVDAQHINLRDYYLDYPMNPYLVYSLSNIGHADSNFFTLESSNLTITPFARGISYSLIVSANDYLFNNANSALQISITESRYLDFYENIIPTLVQVYTSYDVPVKLGTTPYTFDLTPYYVKAYPDKHIQGSVVDAYIVDSNTLIPTNPITRPRDGILNMRQSNVTFDYIGTIDNDVLTIYPDNRGTSYVLEVSLWLSGYSNIDWMLIGSTFVVNEA